MKSSKNLTEKGYIHLDKNETGLTIDVQGNGDLVFYMIANLIVDLAKESDTSADYICGRVISAVKAWELTNKIVDKADMKDLQKVIDTLEL